MSKAKGINGWIYGLCFLAGYANIVGFLKFGVTTSHVTGNMTKVADNAFKGYMQDLWLLLSVIFIFFIGNVVAGIMIKKREFGFKDRYGVVLIIGGGAIIIATRIAYHGFILLYIIPLVLGIQNGLFITYRGVVVRTTHLTGTITDLGTSIGRLIAHGEVEPWKIFYYAFTILCFIFGGFVGGVIFYYHGRMAFFFLGVGYILLGGAYKVIKSIKEKKWA
jgi:uncharacterized membrane protein YoaK (UPF0700 family)